MNQIEVIDVANSGDVQKTEIALRNQFASILNRNILTAQKKMEFLAVSTLTTIQKTMFSDLKKGKQVIEIDFDKYSYKLDLTCSKANSDLNSFIIGHCNNVGMMVGKVDNKQTEVYTFAFKPSDAKKLIDKMEKVPQVTIKSLK